MLVRAYDHVSESKLMKTKYIYEHQELCREDRELFSIQRGLRQGCLMIPWLPNFNVDEIVKQLNGKVIGRGATLRTSGMGYQC